MPIDVLILVVSYRNNTQLVDFLRQQALAALPPRVAIVAVANGLDGPAQEELRQTAPPLEALELLPGEANPGYFGGAARGMSHYLKRGPMPEWIIVTNDDIYFAEDFFPRLMKCSWPPDTGVLAPATFVPATNVQQNPYLVRRPPRWRLEALMFLFSHPSLYRYYLKLRSNDSPPRPTAPGDAREIYAPHGACMLFNSRYFGAGADLNHFALLYGEENFVAESCREAGLRVRYEPGLRVTHQEHSAMKKVPSEVHLQYMRDATAALLDRYYRNARNSFPRL